MAYNDKNDLDYLIARNGNKPIKPPMNLISNYVQDKRILPPSTPFPGFWDNARTPYTVEIMDNMSPASAIQHSAVMKGAQLGLTAGAENVIAYWMDESPAEILFISATDKLIEKWATKRLDPLIDSCGFRSKIFAQTENKHSRRTGDKTFSKEFIGGALDMASAQSAASLRAESKRILIRDEIDGAPPLLRTGEGNWLEVSYARTNAWGSRRKILDISTPTTFLESLINQQYEAGDQRQFFVPCPYCGEYQPLDWGSERGSHGMRASTKAGEIETVYYLCVKCHDAIFNHQKSDLLTRGKWEPTAKSFSRFFRSYQLSSLYSPPGMMTWVDLWEKYRKAQEEPEGMRSFINLYLGLPYKESGSRPKLDKVIELRGAYRQGTIPDGVLFLTAAIDVQRGSEKDENNPPRLEMEILGHGIGFRTWSILYRAFYGEVLDPFSGAWEILSEWATETQMAFERSDGMKFSPSLIFIDSGDGAVTDVVYRFASTWLNTFPCKGFGALKVRKRESGDPASPSNFKRYGSVKAGEDLTLYEISTNFYKTTIYNNLKIERQDTEPQKAGFCDFPIDYGEKYFRMLTAEEKRRDGSFHCPAGRRNEALDVRVYNLCAADVYLGKLVYDMRAHYKGQGWKPHQLEQINHRYVLEILRQRTARRFDPAKKS
jgi:phage terminase large subunit GpA-like protein